MIRTLATEAVVVAKRMIRPLPTEAIVVVIAKMMIRVPVAKAARLNQLKAETMTRGRAAETIPVNVPPQSFGSTPAVAVEQRPDGGGRGG